MLTTTDHGSSAFLFTNEISPHYGLFSFQNAKMIIIAVRLIGLWIAMSNGPAHFERNYDICILSFDANFRMRGIVHFLTGKGQPGFLTKDKDFKLMAECRDGGSSQSFPNYELVDRTKSSRKYKTFSVLTIQLWIVELITQ